MSGQIGYIHVTPFKWHDHFHQSLDD